ncbi:MAG: hypothetical protein ACTH0V_11465 [Microbacteriaceae bacterium]
MNTPSTEHQLERMLEERMSLARAVLTASTSLAAAKEQLANAQRTYADAHKAAINGGWTTAELRKAGLHSPTGTAPRRPRRRAAPSNDEHTEDTRHNGVAGNPNS